MKRLILLGYLMASLSINAQDFYSSADCKAGFKFAVNPDILTILPATAINFYDISVGDVKYWFWDCGDSLTSEEQNPMFIFNHPIGGPTVKISPYRKISLTILTTDGCKSTFTQTINIIDGTVYNNTDTVKPECQVGFRYNLKDVLMGPLPSMLVEFYYKSYPEAKEWYWDFGDGTTSNEANPTHTYYKTNNSGSITSDSVYYESNPYRNVCLTIITEDSCKVFYCETIQVFNSKPKPGCQAIFKYYESERDTSTGTAIINFNNYSEGENLAYFWKFSNGVTSTEKEPVVKFDLKEPVYKACLTVKGADGCTSEMCDAVYIHPTVIWDSVYIDPVVPECQVGFGYNMKDVLMGPLPSMLVEFYYKSYPEAKEWYWDFGDGTTSNEANPTHTYFQTNISDSIAGDSMHYIRPYPFRTVCLTVITEDSCKVSYCETIQVFSNYPLPEPDECKAYFKYYQPDDIVSIPEVVPIQLVDVTEGAVVSREWVFEDGTSSNEKELLVMFNIFQPEHKVALTVSFADGCVNTYYGKVILKPETTDTIAVDPTCPYIIKVDGGFPTIMSSCAGWASARIYHENELVEPAFITWSTGDTLAKISDLCPQKTYTVKAQMPDGCTVSTKFVLDADGVITPISIFNWWLTGEREKLYVQSDVALGLKIQWRLCDGTMIEADSIPLDAINCGGTASNMIVKDLLGNVVYSENISLKGTVTGIETLKVDPSVKLWPNPVSEQLNIRYSGDFQQELIVEVFDVMGKRVSSEIHRNISDNQEIEIKTELLRSGIYVCRISASGKIIDSQKFSRK